MTGTIDNSQQKVFAFGTEDIKIATDDVFRVPKNEVALAEHLPQRLVGQNGTLDQAGVIDRGVDLAVCLRHRLIGFFKRLRALSESGEFSVPPEVEKEDPRTVEEERRLFESRRSEHETALAIARQQLSQRQQELVELRAKHEQAAKAFQALQLAYEVLRAAEERREWKG